MRVSHNAINRICTAAAVFGPRGPWLRCRFVVASSSLRRKQEFTQASAGQHVGQAAAAAARHDAASNCETEICMRRTDGPTGAERCGAAFSLRLP